MATFKFLGNLGYRQPPVEIPPAELAYGDAEISSPVSGAHRPFAVSNYSIAALVPVLFVLGSPFAIFRRIVAHIVNAFKGVIFGSNPHVSKKVFKLFPRLAISDSSLAIVFISRIVGVVAPVFHALPCSILYGSFFPVRSAVFPAKTPTTSTLSSANSFSWFPGVISAVALAVEKGAVAIFRWATFLFFNNKKPKSLTDAINLFHGSLKLGIN